MPRSTTTTSTPASSGSSGSSTRTRVSSTWPSTSTSPGRWENLRSDTLAVVSVTALGSIAVTRPIGTKILRRVSSSTTSPSTRGCWRTMLMLITTSRTRPMDSPSGPKHHHPREPGRVDPVHRRHDSKGRECGCGKPVSTPPNLPFGSRQQRQDDREGQGAARRRGVPRPRGRRRAGCQGRGAHSGGGGAGRARAGRISCAAFASTTGRRRGPTPTSSRWCRPRARHSISSCCRR